MRLLVYPYHLGSISAKRLSLALNSRRIRPDGRYRALWNDLVINWGNSTIPTWYGRIINNPESVKNATNKLRTFDILSQFSVSIPPYSTSRDMAESWCSEGSAVYCRSLLSGHSGNGITIANTTGEIIPAKLYTKQIKAKTEYRVHCTGRKLGSRLLDFQQKKRRTGADANHLIRNHGNGYVYAREGVILPEDVKEQALNAIIAMDLDFGAVDIGYVERENKAYVYEVNTAPGLENTTLNLYTNMFKEIQNVRGW